ncbi:MAG TPA: CvpA family protein [Ktedonobacteraceae bacterium]|nr:CvpA family protein [Ktedonobacteraceae bacterium]
MIILGTFNWIDLLFLATIVLLIFNGFRNGALFSIINLVSIPVAIAVAYFFGKPFALFFAKNGLQISPIISYIVLFIATILVIQIIGTSLRGTVKHIPVLGCGDSLLGGFVGFFEAWLIWVIVLFFVGKFLNDIQASIQTGKSLIPGLNITVQQYQVWHDTYNQTLHNSLFARVNGFFIKELPAMPRLSWK